ncbi:MAG: type II toxin-antitoxin system HicB family antitoxin [Herpetosiphonaceae bacterium]|nr:type II toxin-antitoxin system HicB family antitoxin [Herpetosiphonaceae bacterium]
MTKVYAVVLEHGEHNWSAYVPDLPGCIATGTTREQTLALIQEAIAFHIEGMQFHNQQIPEPTTQVEWVEVAAS